MRLPDSVDTDFSRQRQIMVQSATVVRLSRRAVATHRVVLLSYATCKIRRRIAAPQRHSEFSLGLKVEN